MKSLRFIAVLIIMAGISAFISWSLPGFPAFAFIATLITFIYANLKNEEQALIFGFFTGLALDLVTQEIIGINSFALSMTSFLASSLRRFFDYRSIAWYFIAGTLSFVLRTLFVLFAHLIVDGTLLITTDLRAFASAALWVGIVSSFYFLALRKS